VRFPKGLSAAFAAILAMTALAGCTAAELAPTATPTASSEPSIEQIVTPGIRIPTTCAQLADVSVFEGWFETAAYVRTDEKSALTGVYDVAYREAGALSCWWSSASTGFEGSRVNVTLLPDAEAGFQQQENDEVSNPYLKQDTAGDESSYSCGSYGNNWSCSASMLVGGVWADVWILVDTSGPLDESVASQRMQSLLVRMSAILRNAQPEGSPWKIPVEAFDGAPLCDPAVAVPWLQGVGVVAPAGTGSDFGYQQAFVRDVARLEECGWLDDNGGSVGVSTVTVPGGAWIFESEALLSSVWNVLVLAEKVDIEGLDDARLGCDVGGCVGVVSVGGSAVSVTAYGLNREQFVAALAAMPTGIA
jgi:hypothetical protein